MNAEIIGGLHKAACRLGWRTISSACLIALGETDGNASWSLPAEARWLAAGLSQEDAVRQCLAVLDGRPDIAVGIVEEFLGDCQCTDDNPCGAAVYYDEGDGLPWRIADDQVEERYATLAEAVEGAKAWTNQ